MHPLSPSYKIGNRASQYLEILDNRIIQLDQEASRLNFDTLSLRDYLILRTAAQRLQEKYTFDLRQCPESMRLKSLESIYSLDQVILRCVRRECSFTADECRLLMAAVVNYRGILPQSSKNAHAAIPLLLEKLSILIMAVYSERESVTFNKENKVDPSSQMAACT